MKKKRVKKGLKTSKLLCYKNSLFWNSSQDFIQILGQISSGIEMDFKKLLKGTFKNPKSQNCSFQGR